MQCLTLAPEMALFNIREENGGPRKGEKEGARKRTFEKSLAVVGGRFVPAPDGLWRVGFVEILHCGTKCFVLASLAPF